MRIDLHYGDDHKSLQIDVRPDQELSRLLVECIGMLFVCGWARPRSERITREVDDHIDMIVAGGIAYLNEHRRGMGRAERLGGAN